MASKNLGSAQFVAVYRLEFYKNKNNWMSHDQKKTESGSKNKLNVTFDVEQGDNLNDAFIETDSDFDKAPNANIHRAPNLAQEWLESVDIWPTDFPDTLKSLLVGQRAHDDGHVRARKGQSETISPFTLPEGKLNTTPDAMYENQLESQRRGYERGDNMHFDADMNGTFPETEWRNGVLYYADSSEASEVPMDVWTLSKQVMEGQQLSESVDSYSEFCRGASLNAHCSEVELNLNDSLDANAVARMSSTELHSSIQTHARALAALLRENNERLKLRKSTSNASNGDADVTRDHAEFVAGSFRNRDYRVHIEYGRPVRLNY